MFEKTHKRKKQPKRKRSSIAEADESKYSHDAFESTHDFAKEAVDCLQSGPTRSNQEQQSYNQYHRNEVVEPPMSYANTTETESERLKELVS